MLNIHEEKWLCFACALFVSRLFFSVNLWSKVTKYHKPITKQQMQWQLAAPPTNHMTSCTHTYFTAIIFYRYYRCYTFIFYAQVFSSFFVFFAVDFFWRFSVALSVHFMRSALPNLRFIIFYAFLLPCANFVVLITLGASFYLPSYFYFFSFFSFWRVLIVFSTLYFC